MKELTPQQQTLWNLAMTGGSVYSKKDDSIYQLCHSNLSMVFNNTDNNFLPILHSLNKLTETVLEGGKVPLVELFKICMQNNYLPNDFFKKEKPIFNIEDDAVNLKIGAFTFGFDLLDNSFVLVLEDNILTVFNQKQLFDQLCQWGFNTENLPDGTYIEKSTLKL